MRLNKKPEYRMPRISAFVYKNPIVIFMWRMTVIMRMFDWFATHDGDGIFAVRIIFYTVIITVLILLATGHLK